MILEYREPESAALAIGAIVFVAAFVALASRLLVSRLINLILTRYPDFSDKTATDALYRPMVLAVFGVSSTAAVSFLILPEGWSNLLVTAGKLFSLLSLIWLAMRLIRVLGIALQAKAAETETKTDDILVPLLEKALRVAVIVVGALMIADTFDMNVGGILAGLGLGGLAFALAAKDVVENLFGSITVLVDRPFHVGDWVKIDDIEGTVETVGFRSTRVRTFYNSVVSIPNSRMITTHVDNMGAREYRRLKTMIGVEYGTPYEKIDAFCVGIRELVIAHPKMRNSGFYVHLNGFGASSIDILVYVFFDAASWADELAARHEFLGQIMQLAEKTGVSFAFPTQTLHVASLPDATPHHD